MRVTTIRTQHKYIFFMCLLVASGCSGQPGVLEMISPPTPSQAARDAFNLNDPDLRRRSVALLAASNFGGEAPYLRMYRLLLDDPDPTVRAACIKAIGMHGTMQDVKLFTAHLDDEDRFVRWEAAKALQRFHDPSVSGELVRVLGNDEDPDVRMAAAYALGQYPQQSVFQALVGALDDRSYSVVQASGRSLQTLTGYDFGYDGSLWMMWSKKQSDKLFQHGQPYTWQPYVKPRGLINKMMFWAKPTEPQPQAPKAEDAQGQMTG